MRILAGQIALETKLFLRRKDELFWNLAFPMFFMVLYDLIYGDTMWGDILAIEYMFPGIIVMALMVNGIMVTATVFVEERGKGIYRRLSLTPLKRQTIIGAQILHRYIVTLVQTLLLLVVGVFAFKVNIVGNYFFWCTMLFKYRICSCYFYQKRQKCHAYLYDCILYDVISGWYFLSD